MRKMFRIALKLLIVGILASFSFPSQKESSWQKALISALEQKLFDKWRLYSRDFIAKGEGDPLKVATYLLQHDQSMESLEHFLKGYPFFHFDWAKQRKIWKEVATKWMELMTIKREGEKDCHGLKAAREGKANEAIEHVRVQGKKCWYSCLYALFLLLWNSDDPSVFEAAAMELQRFTDSPFAYAALLEVGTRGSKGKQFVQAFLDETKTRYFLGSSRFFAALLLLQDASSKAERERLLEEIVKSGFGDLDVGVYWKCKALVELAELAETPQERQNYLLKLVDFLFAGGEYLLLPDIFIALLEDAFSCDPDAKGSEAALYMLRVYLKANRLDEAITVLRKHESLLRQKRSLSQAWMMLASNIYGRNQNKAIEFAIKAIEANDDKKEVERAWSLIGRAEWAKGNPKHEEEIWLKANDPTMLAAFYIRQKDWEKALHWVRQWQTVTSCGTCTAMRIGQKHSIEALLLVKLKRFEEINEPLRKALNAVGSGYGFEQLLVLLVDEIYHEGQLPILKRLLLEHKKNPLSAFFLQVIELMERKQTEQLIAILDKDWETHGDKPSWQRRLVSWALGQLGQEAIAPLLNQWSSRQKDWLYLYTLLFLPDPKIWEQVWQTYLTYPGYGIENAIRHALIHANPNFRRFVKSKAMLPEPKESKAAKEFLTRFQQAVTGPPIEWFSSWDAIFVRTP
ncbi:MAG: hypothetical protein NZ805_06540 [Armatimonadetes bacterium]|nr:hypothetical protein [Armatimonadota bacterium]MDW8026982.1 hypothetical protein [Armatimonadota bacterium]